MSSSLDDTSIRRGLDTPAPPPSHIWRPAPLDIAAGWVTGTLQPSLPRRAQVNCSPRQALEEIILEALGKAPCLVAFSGGRDSSALLAVAIAMARAHGRPDPIAVTRVFPGAADADESEWQELVVRHLGVTEWVRLSFHQELDLLGPVGRAHVREHGVLWPPLAHTAIPVFELAAGGVVLTGDGGDEFLGQRRGAVLAHIMRTRRARRDHLRFLRTALARPARRAATVRRRYLSDAAWPWLRPEALEVLLARLVRDEVSEPLAWHRSIRWLTQRRGWQMGLHNRQLLARGAGTEYVDPLQHPRFLEALRRAGGYAGFSGRTTLLRHLVGDLLPDEVLTRTSKANFNSVILGAATHEFVRSWDGSGVDPRFVDLDVLAGRWRTGEVPVPSLLLLQSAWLASTA